MHRTGPGVKSLDPSSDGPEQTYLWIEKQLGEDSPVQERVLIGALGG